LPVEGTVQDEGNPTWTALRPHPPGSTFKVVTAMAAAQRRQLAPSHTNASGDGRVGNFLKGSKAPSATMCRISRLTARLIWNVD
jgi:hypothetical protein